MVLKTRKCERKKNNNNNNFYIYLFNITIYLAMKECLF